MGGSVSPSSDDGVMLCGGCLLYVGAAMVTPRGPWVCNGQYSVVSLSLVEQGFRWRISRRKEVRKEITRVG